MWKIKSRFVKNIKGRNIFDFIKRLDPWESSSAVKSNKIPYVVNFKQGLNLMKDAFKPKPVSIETAKRNVRNIKSAYQSYKRKGGTKSLGKWAIDNGFASKPTF